MSDPPTNEDLAVVAWCDSAFEANALVALLADYELRAHGPGAAIEVPWRGLSHEKRIPVLVLESQLEQARQLIHDAREDASRINWDQVDIGNRADHLPLKAGHGETPVWFQTVAIAGLCLLALTIVGMAVYVVFG